MKKNKLIKTIALTLTLVSVSSIAPIVANATTGYTWKKVNNYWYYTDNNGVNKTGWFQTGDGNWYYSYSSGILAVNTWIESNGKWYYLGESGAMVYNRVVDNCTIGAKGYWVPNIKESFTKLGIEQNLDNFSFCGFENLDSEIQKKYIKNTINITNNELSVIEKIVVNLAQNQYNENDVKEKLIGMTTDDGKYIITNVYMAKVRYELGVGEKYEVLNSSNVFDYKPQSQYYFDIGRLIKYGYRYNFDWGVYRLVLEFEEI